MISNAFLSLGDARKLFLNFRIMTGSEEYQNRRNGIGNRLKELWPNLTKPEAGEDEETEKRKLVLDEFDKRAIGEGLRSILKLKEANGTDYEVCMAMADSAKIGKWFRLVTAQSSLPAFDGISDDEPQLGDPEKTVTPEG